MHYRGLPVPVSFIGTLEVSETDILRRFQPVKVGRMGEAVHATKVRLSESLPDPLKMPCEHAATNQ